MIDQVDIKKMHHRNAPDTEVAAAHKVAPRVVGRRLQILCGLAQLDRAVTGSELAENLGLSILSVRPRLTELQELNCILDTETRRKNEFGNTEIVWQITEKGWQYVY
jgi:predicted ArsR family transcriptional regulator